MNLKNISCFILVGGKSSRFKDDKSKLFYKYQYNKCKKIFKKVYLVAKTKKFKKYPFFIEKSKEYIPIYPLYEIIKKHKRVFILSVDTPCIKDKTIKKLIRKKSVAKTNPLIGYYSYIHLKQISHLIKTSKKLYLINKNKTNIPKKEDININYKQDLKMVKFLKYH